MGAVNQYFEYKFGLVYPGLGWVVWKDKKYLPDVMSFSVNYLGAEIAQVGLNFSRPAAQILVSTTSSYASALKATKTFSTIPSA